MQRLEWQASLTKLISKIVGRVAAGRRTVADITGAA
jgi:hypothetical protein